MKRLTPRHTLAACCAGYVTQSAVNMVPSLLFIIFQRQLGISLGQLTALIAVNFGVQLLIDAICTLVVDKIGYRCSAVIAHAVAAAGLVLMGVLPMMMENSYAGLLMATICCAVGSGTNEVIISPMVEALPGERKAGTMSILHSFYCWGVVAVVLLTTLFLQTAGAEHWYIIPILWALLPLCNAFAFAAVPLYSLISQHEKALPLRKLFSKKLLWLFMLMMVCSGAAEQAMSQWSSLFAEAGLGVSKTMGDLLGLCLFSILMGGARILYGLKLSHIRLEWVLAVSSVLCVGSYLLVAFSPWPVLSLMGCALVGLSVGVMWPGTFSLAAQRLPLGGTAMFAMLALCGDLGCASGPGLAGLVMERTGMSMGLLTAIVFPILLVIAALGLLKHSSAAVTGKSDIR